MATYGELTPDRLEERVTDAVSPLGAPNLKTAGITECRQLAPED